MQKTILLVDDEFSLRETIALFLRADGFNVIEADNGESALQRFWNNSIDLVILDVKLPDMSGFDICRSIRMSSDVSILFLSALSDDDYYVLGYRVGADDYIAKPFKPSILSLKVRRMLERAKSPQKMSGLLLDDEAFLCTVDGEAIQLTPKEFLLLRQLVKNEGKVCTRESLLNNVWGVEFYGESRVVDNHIKKLRHKLGPAARNIKTIISIGYKYEVSE